MKGEKETKCQGRKLKKQHEIKLRKQELKTFVYIKRMTTYSAWFSSVKAKTI